MLSLNAMLKSMNPSEAAPSSHGRLRAGLHRSHLGATLLALVAVGLSGTASRSSEASPLAPATASVQVGGAKSGTDTVEVILSNGSVWRGFIGEQVEVKAIEGGSLQTFVGELLAVERLYVKLATVVGGIEGHKIFVRTDMRSMTTVAGAASSAATGGTGSTGATNARPGAATAGSSTTTPDVAGSAKTASTSGHPGVFYLPMEGTLGIGLRNEELIAIAEEADKYGPGQIIVLMIDSPGGLVIEGDEIHETFKKWKHKHRFVAWIRKAISGGAFTALHCDEIYFMSVGSLGAITMFDPSGSIKGERLQAWLRKCSEVAEMGGRSGIPVRSMIDFTKVTSYDRDEKTGKVTWYDSTQGEFLLSSGTENLTFNAQNALHSGFSDGTADTEAELAVLLGIGEWKEVNDSGRRLHKDWQATIKRCLDEVPRLMIKYQDQGGGTERGLGIQIGVLRELIRWWDRAYHVMAYEIQRVPPKETLERLLKDVQKQLADLRERNRQR